MVSLGDFSRIVSAIHAAAITPQHWIEAMEAVRSAFESTSAGMIAVDGSRRVIKSAFLPEAAETSYRDYFHRVDYVLEAVEQGPVGLIRSGDRLVALNARSEFNHDWMRPYGLEDGLFVRLTCGAQPTSLVIATPGSAEGFATPERVGLVNALVPHLQQALRTQEHLDELAHRAHDVAEAVDSMRHGVFVVGSRSTVHYANRVAEAMLAIDDGPQVRCGRLGLRIPSADVTLHRHILDALGDNDSDAHVGSSLLCPRADGKRPYVVHVVPFASTAPGGAPEPRALVIVVDPEQRVEPPWHLLTRLYGLTRAEAEVALRVMRGEGLQPLSEEMSLSMATVKTHLQHVFAKTDTHRQAELVRLLLAIVP